jgi:predicted  nucleic acid-binding Zn-ribbon protein
MAFARKEKKMPTRKNTNTQEMSNMRSRISTLTDRIAFLENELKTTQTRIQKDISRLVEMLNKKG